MDGREVPGRCACVGEDGGLRVGGRGWMGAISCIHETKVIISFLHS